MNEFIVFSKPREIILLASMLMTKVYYNCLMIIFIIITCLELEISYGF